MLSNKVKKAVETFSAAYPDYSGDANLVVPALERAFSLRPTANCTVAAKIAYEFLTEETTQTEKDQTALDGFVSAVTGSYPPPTPEALGFEHIHLKDPLPSGLVQSLPERPGVAHLELVGVVEVLQQKIEILTGMAEQIIGMLEGVASYQRGRPLPTGGLLASPGNNRVIKAISEQAVQEENSPVAPSSGEERHYRFSVVKSKLVPAAYRDSSNSPSPRLIQKALVACGRIGADAPKIPGVMISEVIDDPEYEDDDE